MKRCSMIAMLLFLALVVSAPAIAQNGWLLMLPPVDEAQIKTLPQDLKFQTMGFEEKRSVIKQFITNKTLPIAEWVQQSAFDSAARCEDFKSAVLELQERGILNYQRHQMTEKYKAEAQVWARERKAFKDQVMEMAKGEKDEEKRKRLLETLEAWDRSFEATEARMDLSQLVENEQTREGRCVPAAAVFAPKH